MDRLLRQGGGVGTGDRQRHRRWKSANRGPGPSFCSPLFCHLRWERELKAEAIPVKGPHLAPGPQATCALCPRRELRVRAEGAAEARGPEDTRTEGRGLPDAREPGHRQASSVCPQAPRPAAQHGHLAGVWSKSNAPHLYLLQQPQAQQEGWDRGRPRVGGSYSRLCGQSKKMRSH